jgi:N-acetylglutamate synthase
VNRPMEFTINRLTIEHCDDVLALWRQCEGVGLSDADSREQVGSYIERNPGMSFVATVGDQVVGGVLGGHDGRRGYLHHLAVRPDFRRRGIGRRLVEHSLAALERAGIQKCHIFIFTHNKNGIAFWESAGWQSRLDIGILSKTIGPGTECDC